MMTKQKKGQHNSLLFSSSLGNTTNLMTGEGAENCSDPIEFKNDKMLKIRLTKKSRKQEKSIYEIGKKYV